MNGFTARVRDEGWYPPNVGRVSVTGNGFLPGCGTALVVGERYAVTCLHVLTNLVAEGDNTKAAEGAETGAKKVPDLPRLTVDLRLGDSAVPVRAEMPPLAQDARHDLALLRLAQPCAHWMAFPRGVPRGTAQREVVAFGTTADGELELTTYEGHADLRTVQRTNGRDEQRAVEFGAPGGFSGGPVFAEDDKGEPLLVGLARLGGDEVNWSKLIARDAVIDFLMHHLPVLHDPDDCPSPWNGTWRGEVARLGLKPEVAAIEGADLPAFWHVEPRPGHYTYVGIRPIASRSFGQLMLADDLPDAAAVQGRLRTLSDTAGKTLRLPTVAELQALERRLGAEKRYRLAGLPPDMRLFGDAAHPQPTPEGCLEWVDGVADSERGRSAMRPCEILGDGVVRPVPRRAGRPAVMRLAFDV